MQRKAVALVLVMLLALLPAGVQANEAPPQLLVNWLGEGSSQHYTLVMGDDATYTIDVTVEHERNAVLMEANVSVVWSLLDGRSTASIVVDRPVAWGDAIELEVEVLTKDGLAVSMPQLVRGLEVGRWNQPMADHELTTTSSWTLEQEAGSEEEPQTFALFFDGQGWQQRNGDVLEAWELGDGRLLLVEASDGSTIDLNLSLDRVWRNETTVEGVLVASVFDAVGHGILTLQDDVDGLRTLVSTTVTDASLNRSVLQGVIDERLRLEANGSLTIEAIDPDEAGGSFDLDGTVTVLLLETWDHNGTRRLDHQQIEAQATLVLIEEGTRMDLDLDAFATLQRWQDGERVDQRELLKGEGTFGFEDQDENATMVVNGTVHAFHQESVDGRTTEDRLHVDGTLSGDVQGTFGLVRGIDSTTEAMNASGETFEVNIIHQEDWFNITGLGGGSFLGGADLGSHHNESWSYDVTGIDYDNRTVRRIWEQTGPDPSSGDERPPRSPVPFNATAPEPVEGLGEIDVGRETGLVPLPLVPGDRLFLDGQSGLALSVEFLEASTDIADGRTFNTLRWEGSYDGVGGSASGHLVASGPLSGLSTSVTRSVEVPFGEEGDVAWLNETQHLDRVLSPSIVTEGENTEPALLAFGTPAGGLVAEGGRSAVVVAEVSDPDWNLRSVEVDLTALGLGWRTMNDRGIDGDMAVGDDLWSTTVSVNDGTIGDVVLPVRMVDAFTTVMNDTAALTVANPGPRMTGFDLVPDRALRGASLILEVTVVDQHGVDDVSLDLTALGGGVETMLPIEGTDRWNLNFPLPATVEPGWVDLVLEMTDGLGTRSTTNTAVNPANGLVGPFMQVDGGGANDLRVLVLNDAPTIHVPDTLVVNGGDRGSCVTYTVSVEDMDGVRSVQIDRGVLTPIGSSAGWADMRDDGEGEDAVAGDGLWTSCVEIRSGTPLGAHEILLRASDEYGEVSPTASAVVRLDAGGDPTEPSGGLSNAAVWGLLGLGALVVVGLMFTLSRRGPKRFEDAFGDR